MELPSRFFENLSQLRTFHIEPERRRRRKILLPISNQQFLDWNPDVLVAENCLLPLISDQGLWKWIEDERRRRGHRLVVHVRANVLTTKFMYFIRGVDPRGLGYAIVHDISASFDANFKRLELKMFEQ